MNLPDSYCENMKNLLSKEYDDYIESFSKEYIPSFRVNNLRITTKDFLNIFHEATEPIPYIENGFYYDKNCKLSLHPYYFAGLYYLQESSAMLPANRLPIDANDCVCDLCASPGGKSTEIAAKRPRFLLSNDISYSRCLALSKNLELAGVPNVCVSAENPEKLAESYCGFFDKILVDAPCSGEGMFHKDDSLIKDWQERGPKYYAPIQKDILESAYKMLKPGGMIMYSTCTFSIEEDEQNIDDFLCNHSDLSLIDMKGYSGLCSGINYPGHRHDLSLCKRVFPHKMNGEGHFMALMQKSLSENMQPSVSETRQLKQKFGNIKRDDKSPDNEMINPIYEAVLHALHLSKGYCYRINDSLMFFPEQLELFIRNGIRYVKTGLCLGTFNAHGKFTPDVAVAHILTANDFSNTLSLTSSDERIFRYLKGETIFPDNDDHPTPKGDVLICVDGFGLGFARFDGTKYKNLFRNGWRLNT